VAAQAIVCAVDCQAHANTTKYTTRGEAKRAIEDGNRFYSLMHDGTKKRTIKTEGDEALHRHSERMQTAPLLTKIRCRRGYTTRSHLLN